jgi:hypothetical protein
LGFAVVLALVSGTRAPAQEAEAGTTEASDEVAELSESDLAAHQAREDAFNRAANEYLKARNINDWRVRVGIDRRLLRAAGKLPPQYLAGRLDANPGSMEISTAVAVCLGEGSLGDPPQLVADLLTELLGSPIERVRYRAAEAIIARVQDGTMPVGIEARLTEVLEEALVTESNALNADSMKYGVTLLKPDPEAAEKE